ncbi:hypothetical protein RRG08_052960 [Elysia crispata]|uniref:Rubicon Homology domain-containing protein n=1 Tax=Elysia crispata TaxID=231223 RepID=A0AAE0ZK17_9GAST|nr:hypothetical protein RRG08_052960 [Elysia crispata]
MFTQGDPVSCAIITFSDGAHNALTESLLLPAPDTGLYLSSMTKPAEGQSLISYLTSQDFNTCANLDKENAHFHIAEALISAFESMNWNRMMKKVNRAPHPERGVAVSSSSEEEGLAETRQQRVRIRKRDKMMGEKSRALSSTADRHAATTARSSFSTSSIVSSSQDISSLSGASSGSGSEDDERQIDLTMSSSDAQGSLSALRSSGLSLSMASLYSEIELQKSNQQLERNSVTGGSTEEQGGNQGSAEAVAISLLRRFSEKQLPKASELRWLVSERDAPQALLPLPASMPILSDESDNSVLVQSSRLPRLRGNHEWAPPRAQIIFSVHPTEKRTVVMKRQNYRCAGCGLKVDPAYIKRYRYCEYLGKYFCQCCHTGETSAIIPGRVLERWDFARYPVSAFSHSLLDRMWQEPLFHISTINATLYRRVRALESIREGRRQLVHLHSLLVVCRRDARIIKELHKLPAHWVSNEDAYSMDDFTQVKTGVMLNIIKSFILLAVAHIDGCPLCQGLGFICEMCNNPRVIFPFQLDTVVSCPVCQTCFHRQCFVPGKCPKCIRMEASLYGRWFEPYEDVDFKLDNSRRKLRKVPLSPDSPDSGEITFHTDGEVEGTKVHSVAMAARTVDQATGSVYGSR